MAVKNRIYTKKFTSTTEYHDTLKGETYELTPIQRRALEKEEVRKKIIKNFGLFKIPEPNKCHIPPEEYFGSDKSMNYVFHFLDNFDDNSRSPIENINYELGVDIRKSGDDQKLEGLSDIEKFVLERGFKKID